MEKLANTKWTIECNMASLKNYLKDDLTENELEYIKFMLKQVAIAAVNDTRNIMNEITNGIDDLK